MLSLRRCSFAFTVTVLFATLSGCSGGDAGGTGPVVETPNTTPSSIAATSSTSATATAGSATTENPSVKVLNSAGQPLAGVNVTFAVTAGGGSVGSQSATTNSTGIATAGQWTLGTVAGTNTLTATVSSLSAITFNATGVAGAAARLAVTRVPSSSAMIRIAFAVQPIIQVQDANGNLVTSSTAPVIATIASGGGAVAGITTVNAAGGIATFSDLSVSGTVGARTLAFTASGVPPVTASLTMTAGAAVRIAVAGVNFQTAGAGLAVPSAATVIVTDDDFNPVSGAPVTFAVTSGGGTLTGASQFTQAAGIATVGSWTLGAAPGTNTVTATLGGTAATTLFTATGTVLPISTIAINAGATQTGTVGAAAGTRPSVIARNALGAPVAGGAITFAVATGGGTVTGATQTTDASGIATVGSWVLGTVAGANSATASANGVQSTVTFNATAQADAPAKLIVERQPVAGQSGLALTQQPIIAVQDQFSNVVTADAGRAITAAITAGGDGTIGGVTTAATAAGKATFASIAITGAAAANRTLTFTTPGLTAATSASVTVTAAPQIAITTITPSVLAPGATATITGFGFAAAGSSVSIDGIAATVTAATTTQLTVQLPAEGFGCGPQRTVAVVVNANTLTANASAPIATAASRPLAVGESMVLSNQSDVGCNQLSSGGAYALTVFNTSTNGSATASFQVRGGPQGVVGSLIASSALRAPPRSPNDLPEGEYFEPTRNEFRRRTEHVSHLEHERAIYADAMAKSRATGGSAFAIAPSSTMTAVNGTNALYQAVTPVPTTPGAISSMKFNYIGENTTMSVRTVVATARVVVVEDVNNTRKNQYDAYYTQLATELENVMFPILATNFGNALAEDALMNNTGRVTLVFTDRVTNLPNVAGFVAGCDIFRQANCPSSNEAPTTYLSVPTTSWNASDISWWQQYMHFVLMHEMKHVVSFAEHASINAFGSEESWLEEGTAEIASEIYTRAGCGFALRQRATYTALRACENANSATWSPTMSSGIGYDWYQFYASIETLSPIVGNVVVNNQLQPFNYESAWSLIRWAADSYGTSDATFFRSIVQAGTVTGLNNLLARTGTSLTTLLGEWSLMVASDDRPGFTPANPRLNLATWRSREFLAGVYAGYSPGYPALFPTAFPLPVRSLGTAAFAQTVPALAAGTTSVFELGAQGGGAQFFSVRASNGTTLPASSTLRVGIVRLQ